MSPINFYIDQMGRTVQVPSQIERIISLVPSQTELLFDLGLADKIVGITKFCIHPADQCKEVVKVGGTKQYKRALIDQLKPDLIIGNKEENEAVQIEALTKDYPVWMSDIYNLQDALAMIEQIGHLTSTQTKAGDLLKAIKQDFTKIQSPKQRLKVAYFIWREPYMLAANDTFIHEMLLAAGFDNAFAHLSRYPSIELSDLKNYPLDLIFLSSEPFPFKKKYFPPFQEVLPEVPIQVVDGEMFSWYGSRLLKAAKYFNTLQSQLARP